VSQPTLIVMAAGIGSRYGGLKQVDPIGPGGEMVIDYSVFDALRAGFDRVVFVIRRDIEEIFREKVGRKVEQRVETVYVFQDLDNVPGGFRVPEERKKPWGTGHAVLACREVVDRPCAVLNADDFYGAGAFQALADFLRGARDQAGVYDYAMVGYALRNALSDYGSVARGICRVAPDGSLIEVQERTRVEKSGEDIHYTENGTDWVIIPPDSLASMNMWGFTPSIFAELAARFPVFLQKQAGNILNAEFFLPTVVNELLEEGKARVRVLPTAEKWFGITNPEDRPQVVRAVREMVERGRYPADLWGAAKI
jgi:NDP-sugar pyrophosphorylase family protein